MTTLQLTKQPFSLKAFELIKFASSICLIAISAQLSIPASFVTGYLMEKGFSKSALYSFFAFVVGNSFVYFTGVPHLAQFVGMKQALYLGIVPFIPGFIFKNLVCTYFYQRLHR